MKFLKENLLRSCRKKCRKRAKMVEPFAASESCWQRLLWPSLHENNAIPCDVPKGHLAVYVGEDNLKRYVINISLLNHPLFQALLDHAREVFDFGESSKLCIPCNENIFLNVVQYAMSPQANGRFSICLK